MTPAVDGGKHVRLSFIEVEVEWRGGGGEEEETEGGGWQGDHGCCEYFLLTRRVRKGIVVVDVEKRGRGFA